MRLPIALLSTAFVIILSCEPKTHKSLKSCEHFPCIENGIVQGDTLQKSVSIVFSGHHFAEGGNHILKVLNKYRVKGNFFFTGDFYRNPDFRELIFQIKEGSHYLGAHSDKHLLYCDWENRDSLLVSKKQFIEDINSNYREMGQFGVDRKDATYYLPPYEWYNEKISEWTKEEGLQLFNFTYGTRTNADYTTPEMDSYQSSDEIWQSIINFEKKSPIGLNGFIMLIHIGTDPNRTDKFYYRLEELIIWLKNNGYEIKSIKELLQSDI